MENFLTILMWVGFGALCAYRAKKQKRNPFLWFLIGLFLGIFGLLILLMLPLIQRWRRSPPQEVLAVAIPPREPQDVLKAQLDEKSAQAHWYYLDHENQQKGPMSLKALEREWKIGNLTKTHYIWNETLQDWKTFEEIFPNLEVQMKKATS